MVGTTVFTDTIITKEIREKRIQIYIGKMPSLSTTVTKVLEVCDSPTTSPNDLNRVIALDPVLTGNVLKLINSAYCALPNQITSLTRAIIMLGLNTVKNLALSTAVMESLGRADSFQALSMDNYWTHSICVGVAAKAIAAQKGVPSSEREEYFVAGLLHDLGKIPLSIRFPDDYTKVLQLARLEQCPLFRAESMIFEMTHGEVGNMIAQKWQLSPAIVDSLTFHHQPGLARPENRSFVTNIALANSYANVLEIGTSGDHFPEHTLIVDLLKETAVNWSVLSGMQEMILAEIDKAKIFLELSKKK